MNGALTIGTLGSASAIGSAAASRAELSSSARPPRRCLRASAPGSPGRPATRPDGELREGARPRRRGFFSPRAQTSSGHDRRCRAQQRDEVADRRRFGLRRLPARRRHRLRRRRRRRRRPASASPGWAWVLERPHRRRVREEDITRKVEHVDVELDPYVSEPVDALALRKVTPPPGTAPVWRAPFGGPTSEEQWRRCGGGHGRGRGVAGFELGEEVDDALPVDGELGVDQRRAAAIRRPDGHQGIFISPGCRRRGGAARRRNGRPPGRRPRAWRGASARP